MAAVADKVKEIVSDELSVDTGIVTPQARFVEDLGADFSATFPGKVVVIDTTSDEATGAIELSGFNPYDISSSPLTKKIYVTDAGKYLPDFTLDQNGDVWLAEQNVEAPGVVHVNAEDGSTLDLVDVGANPLALVFAGE